jgi:glucokinase
MGMQYLIADVGGTNTRVALAHDGRLQTDSIHRYRNVNQFGVAEILQDYLRNHAPDSRPSAVCIDVAGPVGDNQGQLTNLDWTVTTAQLCDATGASRGAIINDMQAQGLALSHLPAESFSSVLKGTAQTGNRIVVNVGTGFNSAVVLGDGPKLTVPGSETGHVNLPVPSPEIFELHQYLTARFGFASAEEVLSGRGLGHIYAFLAQHSASEPLPSSQHIMTHLDSDPLALKSISILLEVFGCVCGNLALTHLPFGGIYLVGGMAQALADHYSDSPFHSAFAAKGRFSEFMSQFSVNLVQDDHAALAGCIAHLQFFENDTH